MPVDPSLRVLVFVPNLGFLAFLFVSLKRPLPEALGSALIVGLCVDLMRHDFLTNMVAFPVSIYAIKTWSRQLNESVFEQIFIGTIGLFIKELTLYVILYIFAVTKLQIGPWFVKREFLTLIGHIPLLFGLTLLNRFKVGAQKNLDLERERRERIRWNPTAKP